MGRRKIEMKMVKDNGCRQVTFSKRRTGLFKKANELATLCGAEVAVVVFSPGGKPFSFGQPTVDSIAAKFLDSSRKNKPIRRESATAEKLNQTLNDRTKLVQDEKKRGEEIDNEVNRFFNKIKSALSDVESLDSGDLLYLKSKLEEIRERSKERLVEVEASSTLLMLSNANPSDDEDEDYDDEDADDDDE